MATITDGREVLDSGQNTARGPGGWKTCHHGLISNYRAEHQISLQIRWGLISLGIKTFHHRAVISVISFMNAPTSDNIAINAARWQKLKSEWKFASYLCNKRKWKENRIFSCEKIRNCLPLTLVPTAPHIITIKFANKRLRPGRPAAIKSDSDIGGRSLIFVLRRGLERESIFPDLRRLCLLQDHV